MRYFYVLGLFYFLPFSNLMSQEETIHLELELHGLVCSLCSNSVERSIRKLPFIHAIEVDLQSAVANIVVNDGKDLSFYAIAKAVEKAGFSVGKFIVYHRLESEARQLHFGQETITFLEEIENSGASIIQLIEKPFVSSKEWKHWKSKLKVDAPSHTIRAVIL